RRGRVFPRPGRFSCRATTERASTCARCGRGGGTGCGRTGAGLPGARRVARRRPLVDGRARAAALLRRRARDGRERGGWRGRGGGRLVPQESLKIGATASLPPLQAYRWKARRCDAERGER